MKTIVIVVVVLWSLVMAPLPASAEWFADAYLGGSHTSVSNNSFQIAGTTVRDLEDSDVSTPLGIRFGYWFERFSWVGLALGFSIFDPNFDDTATSPGPTSDEVTHGVRPLSALIMVRMGCDHIPVFAKAASDRLTNGERHKTITSLRKRLRASLGRQDHGRHR